MPTIKWEAPVRWYLMSIRLCLLPSGLYRRPWNFTRSTVAEQQVAGYTADQELGLLFTLPHLAPKTHLYLIVQ
jgi:hypothetical protein